MELFRYINTLKEQTKRVQDNWHHSIRTRHKEKKYEQTNAAKTMQLPV
jgi:hypothetical protein